MNIRKIKVKLRDKMPRDIQKKYQRNNPHATLPVRTVKVDLTQGKYNDNTFNRTNRSDKSYDKFSYNRNIRNQNIYNNNIHERKNINQNDSNSYYKYSVNSENYNNDSMSLFSIQE